MTNPYEKLIHYWADNAPTAAGSAGEAAVCALERGYGVRLPDDFRQYLLYACPTEDQGMGADLTRWWAIGSIRSLAEECPNVVVVDPSKHLLFADNGIWAWAWAIACGDDGRFGSVFVVDGDARKVAGSFAEFVDMFIEDFEQLA